MENEENYKILAVKDGKMKEISIDTFKKKIEAEYAQKYMEKLEAMHGLLDEMRGDFGNGSKAKVIVSIPTEEKRGFLKHKIMEAAKTKLVWDSISDLTKLVKQEYLPDKDVKKIRGYCWFLLNKEPNFARKTPEGKYVVLASEDSEEIIEESRVGYNDLGSHI